MAKSISVQFDKIQGEIMGIIDNASKRALKEAAEAIARDSRLSMEKIGFHSVTGNLWKSIGVAAVHHNWKSKTNVVTGFAPSDGSRPPLTTTLGPGEDFEDRKKTEYYSGYADTHWKYQKYEASKFSPSVSGMRGDTERNKVFQELRKRRVNATNDVRGSIVLFSALPYAWFVNDKAGLNGRYHSFKWWQNVIGWFRETATREFVNSFKITK